MLFFGVILAVALLVLILFGALSKKILWDCLSNSTFECGFTPYYMTHNSFSIHYFVIGIIFLFLDLELCFIMPFLNSEIPELYPFMMGLAFVLVLIFGLLVEWKQSKMDWVF